MDEAEENHVKHWVHVKLRVNDSSTFNHPISQTIGARVFERKKRLLILLDFTATNSTQHRRRRETERERFDYPNQN